MSRKLTKSDREYIDGLHVEMARLIGIPADRKVERSVYVNGKRIPISMWEPFSNDEHAIDLLVQMSPKTAVFILDGQCMWMVTIVITAGHHSTAHEFKHRKLSVAISGAILNGFCGLAVRSDLFT